MAKSLCGDVEKAVRDPDGFLAQAIAQAAPYQAAATLSQRQWLALNVLSLVLNVL